MDTGRVLGGGGLAYMGVAVKIFEIVDDDDRRRMDGRQTILYAHFDPSVKPAPASVVIVVVQCSNIS